MGLLCKLPKFPSCPVNIKRFLIVLIIIVLVVVIIVGALLMGLFITQAHTETVLKMTIEGRESQLNLSLDQEEVATFYVDDRINDPATVVYYFSKLLIGYKSWKRKACFITTMDKGNIQGLDTILKKFQTNLSITFPMQREEETFLLPPADPSTLGATVNILCSHVPVFWI
uniref:Uncharacterized protein n=1 Tax=Sphaerodactylus townsendi TaxID=933632 RepID=A0ACB8EZR7_9SAUR